MEDGFYVPLASDGFNSVQVTSGPRSRLRPRPCQVHAELAPAFRARDGGGRVAGAARPRSRRTSPYTKVYVQPHARRRSVESTPLPRPVSRGCGRVPAEPHTPASDDQQVRWPRLLLFGKGAVLAHRFERPLAAELDEYEQQPTRDAERDARCSFDKPASSPAGSSRLLGTKRRRQRTPHRAPPRSCICNKAAATPQLARAGGTGKAL
jgi:hypothetical protein